MRHDKLLNESAKIFSTILAEYAGVAGAPHQGQEDPGGKGRLKAWKTMKAEIDRAADEGKPVVNTKEGGRGDPELNKKAREYAKSLGVKYSEEDLDTPKEEKDWGDPRHVQAMKASDLKSGIKRPEGIGPYDAFPEDDPSGKTQENPVSRGVKAINRKRRHQWLGRWKQIQQKGGINISTVGSGHYPDLQKYFRRVRRKNPNAFK